MGRLSNNGGFTLIEILIATAILSIGSVGVATLTAGIIQGNAFSKKLTAATTLAQDQLERIKRLGYANAGGAAGTENYGSLANDPSYKRVTAVTANTPATNMETVTVTVSWNHDTRAVTLKTILSQ
jgi:prepilin-type N-terminal cleavage/methylation domain-containing protein